MKGMLGEIADTQGTILETIKDWRKFWRLRLIKWIAGDRGVLMNIGVEGLLVLSEDQDLLLAEAWLSDKRMDDMRSGMMLLLDQVMFLRSVLCDTYVAQAEWQEAVHDEDRPPEGEFKEFAPCEVCSICGLKRGLRCVQDALVGGGWGKPHNACKKCRKGVLRGKFRIVHSTEDVR